MANEQRSPANRRQIPGRRKSDASLPECGTCNDDPAVCATVPGLRHCEAANREAPTPRTDAAMRSDNPEGMWVTPDFARQLERELTYANSRHESEVKADRAMTTALSADETEKVREQLRKSVEREQELESKLTEARKLADASLMNEAALHEQLAEVRAAAHPCTCPESTGGLYGRRY